MAESLRKASFRCPHCGNIQQEPEHLVSTFCRACGKHFEVGDRIEPGAPPRARAAAGRAVQCYRCGESHEVSVHARSTQCPRCNCAIEFGDLKFSSHASRPVDIRGRLTVTARGTLNHPHIVCTDAVIEGKINGSLRCERSLRLATSGRLSCRIIAASLTIEKPARVEFAHPVEVGEMIVIGQALGAFDCAGAVLVRKHGVLEGSLRASAVTVERGGSLRAETIIEPLHEESPALTA